MIPKIIHYCWFGGKKKPAMARRCIKTWKKQLPGYVVKEWNEFNFDVTSNRYVREAYEAGRYAFVSDYVRLHALYSEGGIYLDTDVEVLGTFDGFLHHHAFAGFETNNFVSTGILAAEQGSAWVAGLLHHYDNAVFRLPDGSMDLTTNVRIITGLMADNGLRLDNSYQDIAGLVTIYPSDIFCPKNWETGELKLTGRTKAIHHFSGSWRPEGQLYIKSKMLLYKCLRALSIEEAYVKWRRRHLN